MKLILKKGLLKSEYEWLPRDLKAGEIVYRYHGPTYGCISHEGIAVTLDKDKIPFFEVPLKYVEVYK